MASLLKQRRPHRRLPRRRPADLPSDLDQELGRLERGYLVEALRRAGGVQVKAAEMLGISERSFWHRVRKYDINIVRQPE